MLPHDIVRAAENWKDLGGPAGDVATFSSLESLFSNIVQAIVALAGVAVFVMFLVGGFSFLLSGGDPKKLEQARGTLTSAIIGLIIIVSAYVIMRILEALTGVDLTTFRVAIPTP